MSTSTLLEELSPPSIPGTTIHTHVACALCGATILEPPSTKSSNLSPSRNGSWSSASLFKNPLTSISNSSSTNLTNPLHNAPPSEPPTQVYIFRLATSSSGLPANQARPTIYPLCATGWCLNRLRTTCSLWAFVRTGIVEKIWEESAYIPPITSVNNSEPSSPTSDKPPPPPPRRTRIGIGALWGSVQRGLSGGKEPEKEKIEESKPAPAAPPIPEKRRLPPPPPSHPPINAPIPKLAQPPVTQPATSQSPPPEVKSTPPPLPQRSRTRDEHQRTPSQSGPPALPPRASVAAPVTNGITEETEAKEPTATTTDEKPSTPAPAEEAPEMDRADSHDSFATAEYPPSSRPSSPATIPLPASGPSTPVQTETALPEVTPAVDASKEDSAVAPTPADVPASESTATEIVAPVPTVPTPGVPPPLPRRAAARTRPTSVVATSPPPTIEAITEVNGVSNADSKPVEAPTEANGTSETPAETTKVESHEPDSSITTETETPSDVKAETEPKAITDIEKSESDSATNTEVTKDHHPQESLSVQPTPVATPLTPHFDDRASQSSVEKVSTSPAMVSEVDSTENHTIGVNGDMNGHGHEGSDEEDEEDELPGTYVTDATWEERTWKEIVKLREDMYWARLGGRR